MFLERKLLFIESIKNSIFYYYLPFIQTTHFIKVDLNTKKFETLM